MMQDSLGGNAKTLMFVNISPADYNQDETATALTYATRVKLITNTANKNQVGVAEVLRMNNIQKLSTVNDCVPFVEDTGISPLSCISYEHSHWIKNIHVEY